MRRRSDSGRRTNCSFRICDYRGNRHKRRIGLLVSRDSGSNMDRYSFDEINKISSVNICLKMSKDEIFNQFVVPFNFKGSCKIRIEY